jgi:hypothetical protein
MAVAHIRVHGFPTHAWMAWARLPLQLIFMVGILWVTRVWPGNCSRGSILCQTHQPDNHK